jgi:hypothetical protein
VGSRKGCARSITTVWLQSATRNTPYWEWSRWVRGVETGGSGKLNAWQPSGMAEEVVLIRKALRKGAQFGVGRAAAISEQLTIDGFSFGMAE